MRKDVKCTFSKMKHRFHILKHGICLHKISNSDKAWTTCCVLHNRLLFIGDLDKGWDEISRDDSQLEFDVPFSMQRLNRHEENEEIRNGAENETRFLDKHSKNGKRVVRNSPLHFLKNV